MHTQQDTLKILNCSKATLSRYVNSGKLERVKQGRKTFYDEHEVASLINEIEANKKRLGKEIKPKEKIEISKELQSELKSLSANSLLTAIGMEKLSSATSSLIDLGLYEECDKEVLLWYALSAQACHYYFVKSMEVDGISMNGEIIKSEDETVQIFIGKANVHPYHKMMLDHQKQMNVYSNQLGLNPLARLKFDIKEEVVQDEMDELLS